MRDSWEWSNEILDKIDDFRFKQGGGGKSLILLMDLIETARAEGHQQALEEDAKRMVRSSCL